MASEATGESEENAEADSLSAIKEGLSDNDIAYYTDDSSSSTIRVGVQYIWEDEDNRDGSRPSELNVVLYIDNEPSELSIILNDANNWSSGFTNLPRYGDDGHEYIYSIKRIDVDGYEPIEVNYPPLRS